jgi:hypothetical protein
MRPHKWAKEIKAWADGAEIEFQSWSGNWLPTITPDWGNNYDYRIKPQPKEPKYLYIFSQTSGHTVRLTMNMLPQHKTESYIGKIKLEVE